MKDKAIKISPSLSISLTDVCNLKCVYCPPYGENFVKCKEMCSIDSILNLIHIMQQYDIPVIRMTGGEPLLFPERVEAILKTCVECSVKKIILNTNGVHVFENLKWLEKYKDSFLLKISLDAVEEELYDEITKSKAQYSKVIKSIEEAVKRGFKIEVNTVITTKNIDYVWDVIQFAIDRNMDIKLFGMNDFEGKVDSQGLYVSLENLINRLEHDYVKCENERLPGNRGIEMHKYKDENGNQILVVEHKTFRKSNGKKIYSEFCKNCKNYPCSTGLFSITLRADGLLQTCRMRPEEGYSIKNAKINEIDAIVTKILEPYQKCFFI